MWLYVPVIAAVALAVGLWRRRKPPVIVTPEELQQLKDLPVPTVKWNREDWGKWQRLLDAGLVTITDVQSDFTVSYVLTITDAGERAKTNPSGRPHGVAQVHH